MSTCLPDLLLDLLEKSTSQAPMTVPSMTQRLLGKRPETTPDEIHDVLEQLLDQHLLTTCRITKAGITQDVYWRTGLRRAPRVLPPPTCQPAPKPKEQTMKETAGDRLVKLIAQHGPLIGADLADKSGLPAKSLDAYLRTQLADGRVETRMGYCQERGRELKHYMTPDQARKWDADGLEQFDRMTAEPDSAAYERDSLLKLVGADDVIQAGEAISTLRRKIHDQGNDLAAANLVLSQMAARLQVDAFERIPGALDELLHALSTRAMGAEKPAGKPALLLIDSAELTEVEMLSDWATDIGMAPNTLAMRIRLGWSVERALTQPLKRRAAK